MPPDDTNDLRTRLQALFGRELVIEQELGRGGMAAVFSAFDPGLRRRVAVKMLFPGIADDAEVTERFLREGRTVAALHHPHVVAVHAVRSDEGAHAIVMQCVEGKSLDVVLSQQPVIPLNAASRILSQVASGLQHAHERGVIHRDVKPSNVLIDADGHAVVSDFGIARRNDGSTVTRTGVVLGTSDYMSPEQRSGERVTPATDQYAFGVMAFEVLTGRMPFLGNLAEVNRGHMIDPPPSLRSLRPDIPLAVEEVVLHMLEKDPTQRLASLAEAEDVFSAQVSHGGDTPRLVRAVTPPTPPAAITSSQNRNIAIIVAAVVVLVATIAIVWALIGRRDSAAPSGASDTPPEVSPPTRRDKTPPPPVSGQTAMGGNATPRVAARGATAREAARGASAPGAVPDPAPSSAQPSAPNAGASVAVAPAPPPVVDSGLTGAAGPATALANAATLADARRLGRAFVTMLNQRRARELAQLTATGGDALARAELIKLTESAPDFAAGFERLPSAPAEWTTGFETELFVDLEWRGGKRVLRVVLYATRVADGWRLVGLGVEPAG